VKRSSKALRSQTEFGTESKPRLRVAVAKFSPVDLVGDGTGLGFRHGGFLAGALWPARELYHGAKEISISRADRTGQKKGTKKGDIVNYVLMV